MVKRVFYLFSIALLAIGCVAGGDNVQEESFKREVIESEGHLFIIGGGNRPEYLMKRYLSLAGESANVLIIPFASGVPEEVGTSQREELLALGAASVEVLFCDKESVDSPENLKMLEGVNAIFFSGGDQNVLASYLNGTQLLEEIWKIYREGGVVGGTSAGAAVMSEVMMTGNPNDMTSLGFGFLKEFVVDQHFIFRNRHGRLMEVLMENPTHRGVGIDEATAIIVKPNSTFEVFGDSRVVIFEPLPEKDSNRVTTFKVKHLGSGTTYQM